jgi:5-oxoprolinase (ATP-hydrolysing) subunit A
MRIDLNADVGESFGAYTLGHDADLIPLITSANIACGFHAGDPGVMRATVALARQHGVAVGAHPGFPDLVGFGRREISATSKEVEDAVVYQIGALAGIAATEGLPLQHVKPHGALYNMAARDAALADAIARATASVDRSLILLGLPGSQLVAAGRRAGLRTASEAFADRAYQADGALVPRSHAGAVIEDADTVVRRAIAMAREHAVIAADGTRVAIEADTICVHGDTPGAAALARRIREALADARIEVAALGTTVGR